MNDARRTVLEAIEDGPIPGDAIAAEYGVPRESVRTHVAALRDAGFEIDGDDAGGYALASVPEYGGPAIEYGLAAPFDVEYHETLPSTNDRARELAAGGASDVVVAAGEQTGGRGRLDREWASPPGGVWLSLVLRPDLPRSHAPLLTLAAAVAVTRAAREAGVDAGIKWPNDVLVAGTDGAERKLAGVLTESAGGAGHAEWVVVGVGANVDVDGADLPEGATSVREQVGDVRRRVFVQRLLEEFDGLRDDLGADPGAILDAWTEHAFTLGREVRVETPGDDVVGEALRVERPGTLVVATGEGERRVHAGDCEHLRPID